MEDATPDTGSRCITSNTGQTTATTTPPTSPPCAGSTTTSPFTASASESTPTPHPRTAASSATSPAGQIHRDSSVTPPASGCSRRGTGCRSRRGRRAHWRLVFDGVGVSIEEPPDTAVATIPSVGCGACCAASSATASDTALGSPNRVTGHSLWWAIDHP